MIIYALASLKPLDPVLEAKPDGVIVGVEGYSNRSAALLNPDDLEPFVEKMKDAGIDVYINALKMFFEPEMDQAEAFLKRCAAAGVVGIYVADEGLLELALENGLESLMIYQPETLITNGLDASVYEQMGFQAISLSHELNLDEIEQIASKISNGEVLVQGHFAWMDSRRPLISNYFEAIEKPETDTDQKLFLLKEQARDYAIKAIQDKNGTHLYSPEPIKSISQMDALTKAGIDRFRIDGILSDNETGARWIQAYRQILEGRDISEIEPVEGTDAGYSLNMSIRKEKSHGQN